MFRHLAVNIHPYLYPDHHIEMTLRVLLNNVTHIIRLSGLLKFSSRHKIFNFSNCPNGIAMCFCQPLYIKEYLGKVRPGLFSFVYFHVQNRMTYCVTRAGSMSSSPSRCPNSAWSSIGGRNETWHQAGSESSRSTASALP